MSRKKYLLVYEKTDTAKGNVVRNTEVIKGEALNQIDFLENKVNSEILNETSWTVYEVSKANSKKGFIHDGTIDHILGE